MQQQLSPGNEVFPPCHFVHRFIGRSLCPRCQSGGIRFTVAIILRPGDRCGSASSAGIDTHASSGSRAAGSLQTLPTTSSRSRTEDLMIQGTCARSAPRATTDAIPRRVIGGFPRSGEHVCSNSDTDGATDREALRQGG